MNTIDKNEKSLRAKQIATEYDGIYPMYVAFYLQAILYAAGRANVAFAKFTSALQAEASPLEIVATVHEALGHTAALSRFFFPSDKQTLARARAANLRRQFEIGNTSPLIDRELRNALEHFDERLDEYLLNDIAGYIFPGPIVDDAELADDPMGHIFRLVDPKKEIFVLLGQKHDFGAVRFEVQRVAELADKIA